MPLVESPLTVASSEDLELDDHVAIMRFIASWFSCYCAAPYCKGGCAEETSSRDLENWMRDTQGVRVSPIYRIAVPGSHDSGTYDLVDERSPEALL